MNQERAQLRNAWCQSLVAAVGCSSFDMSVGIEDWNMECRRFSFRQEITSSKMKGRDEHYGQTQSHRSHLGPHMHATRIRYAPWL